MDIGPRSSDKPEEKKQRHHSVHVSDIRSGVAASARLLGLHSCNLCTLQSTSKASRPLDPEGKINSLVSQKPPTGLDSGESSQVRMRTEQKEAA